MTAAAAIKGWCPTLLSPMQSGDGWLARVKPSAATLSSKEARAIADGAARCGNGEIDLTSRANLQIRGLSQQGAERFAEVILALGLACSDPAVESIRNVMASPLGADDPAAFFDSHARAHDLEGLLGAEPALRALPDKFGILVDGGGDLPLAGVSADIMVRPHKNGIAVSIDGGTLAAPSSPSRLADCVKALATAFLHLSWERREPPHRLRHLVEVIGSRAVFDAAGLSPASGVPPETPSASPIGFHRFRDTDQGWFGVGLPFGRIDAAALHHLADLAERHGDGTLRTTPWRTLILARIPAAHAAELERDIAELGLISDPADSRRFISACVGAPSCLSATVETRKDARRLARALSLSAAETVHVSGCAKSCAHRGAAALTLVGNEGNYDVIRSGTAADRPSLAGLTIDDVLALLPAKKECV